MRVQSGMDTKHRPRFSDRTHVTRFRAWFRNAYGRNWWCSIGFLQVKPQGNCEKRSPHSWTKGNPFKTVRKISGWTCKASYYTRASIFVFFWTMKFLFERITWLSTIFCQILNSLWLSTRASFRPRNPMSHNFATRWHQRSLGWAWSRKNIASSMRRFCDSIEEEFWGPWYGEREWQEAWPTEFPQRDQFLCEQRQESGSMQSAIPTKGSTFAQERHWKPNSSAWVWRHCCKLHGD